MRIKGTRSVTWILLCSILLSLISWPYGEAQANSVQAATNPLGDISGHWAEKELRQWLKDGLLRGYADGSVRPDQPITRAEWMALVNRYFDFHEEASISFSDLSAGDWRYREAAIAVKAGYIEGYANGTVGAGSAITRQEAAVMIARIMRLDMESGIGGGAAKRFTDYADIASWGQASVDAVVYAKLMKGYDNGSFRPEASISRAEAVVTLSRTQSATGPFGYTKAGTYGPSEGVETVEGNVVIRVPGVTLQNTTITGDLLLAEGIGEGDVYLKNVTVQGKTTIEGGGANSVHADNSVFLTVIVNKKSGIVRVVSTGTTTMSSVTLLSPAILEGGGYSEVNLSEQLPSGSVVTLNGFFDSVHVLAVNSTVQLSQGTVNVLHVSGEAQGTTIHTGSGAYIVRLVLETVVKVMGKGIVRNAVMGANAGQSTFENNPLQSEGAGAPSNSQSGSTQPPAAPSASNPNPPTTPVPSEYALVKDHAGKSVIVVATNADLRLRQAALKAASYIEQSTGAKLPVLNEYEASDAKWFANGEIPIYIGLDHRLSTNLRSGLATMDDEGFVIEANNGRIAIAGKTSVGTEHGVYEFLERFVGVRWLMPGPDGDDVPAAASITVPRGTVKQEPAFMSRILSPMTLPTNQTGALQFEWARVNRLPWRFNAFHSMYSIFPGDKYGVTHPEFYPLRNGQRYIPPKGDISNWQPCFTEPGTIDEAVKAAIQFFADNPDQVSFSLGVNDSGGFCEQDPANPNYPGRVNSKGFIDMSDIYYNWVNQIAKRVLEVYPDKWFGVLAYENVIDPPSFPLNPRVVPILTKDRMAWLDPEVKAADEQLMQAWSEVAASTGWYDYIYGSPYLVPRVYPHLMAENYRRAFELGVSVQYAEIYPNWGEGPKAWISAKLQWDPNLDVDALLEEWYERAVGEQAAPDLAAYYELWEKFWTERVPQSEWFERSKDKIYMAFNDPSYLKYATADDITQSRQLLESVLDKAVTPKQKARAAILLVAFEYYEASVISYLNSIATPNDNIDAALESLFSEDPNAVWIQKRNRLLDEFSRDPVLLQPLDPRLLGLVWSSRDSSEQFWGVADYMRANEQAGGRISDAVDLYAQSDDPKIRHTAETLKLAASGAPSLLDNSSFEQSTVSGSVYVPTSYVGYSALIRQVIDPDKAHSGQAYAAVQITGAEGGPFQNAAVKPGPFAARAFFLVPEGTATGNATVQLGFHYIMRNGTVSFFALHSGTLKLSEYAGQGWQSIQLFGEIPAAFNGSEVDTVQMLFYIQSLPPGVEIGVDDVEVYQFP